MRETNSKNEKNRQKLTYLGQCGGEMRLKSRNHPKAHLGPLLNVHTKFKPPSSIWRENRVGTALFQGQDGAKSPYHPS